jgi:NAD+ kinase
MVIAVQNSFQTIGVIGKFMQEAALQQMRGDLHSLVHHLQSRGIDVWIEENTARHAEIDGFETASLEAIGGRVDLAIVLGGDGTMLSVARALMSHQVPLVGINRGRFGFLTDLRAEDMLATLDDILEGTFRRESRMLLTATVMRGNEPVYQGYALNDVVIKSGLRLIELQVEIDGKFVHRQRSDGLILSTPTGTTAYSLSAGGPILHPGLEAIALVPISPHTLSNRPIAVSSAAKIDITVLQEDSAQISFDGQFQLSLEVGDRVAIARADQSITLLHPQDYCYYEMLRNKLNWG